MITPVYEEEAVERRRQVRIMEQKQVDQHSGGDTQGDWLVDLIFAAFKCSTTMWATHILRSDVMVYVCHSQSYTWPSPSSHPRLTPHCEVDLQLADSKGVFAVAEVEAFVILADVENGELEDRTFLRQRVLWTGYNVLLLEPFSPAGVCRRGGHVLIAY